MGTVEDRCIDAVGSEETGRVSRQLTIKTVLQHSREKLHQWSETIEQD